MTYIPPAARQFSDEVKGLREYAEVAPAGDPDGIGVVRGLTFDPETSDWLQEVLDAVQDDRITQWEFIDGTLTLIFAPDHTADEATPFGLAEADAVLNAPEDEDDTEPYEEDESEDE